MKEPMASTRSRLAIEAMVSMYMQEIQQTELLLVNSDFEPMFDTFFGDDDSLKFPDQKISRYQKMTKMLVLATKLPLLNN